MWRKRRYGSPSPNTSLWPLQRSDSCSDRASTRSNRCLSISIFERMYVNRLFTEYRLLYFKDQNDDQLKLLDLQRNASGIQYAIRACTCVIYDDDSCAGIPGRKGDYFLKKIDTDPGRMAEFPLSDHAEPYGRRSRSHLQNCSWVTFQSVESKSANKTAFHYLCVLTI